MRRTFSAIRILIAVAFSFATAATGALAQGSPAAAPASGYRIAGTVVNSITGEPVQRATVAALSEADRKMVASVITDNEGRFSLEGLAAAKYPLTVSKRGYLTAFYDQHDEGFNTAIVTGEDQDTTGLVFRLNPGAAIHGVITGDGGDPVEGAQVMLFRKPQNHNPGAKITPAGDDRTDDTGAYEFDGLEPGEYLLTVNAEPWYALHLSAANRLTRLESNPAVALDVAYPVTFFDSSTDEASATQIVLAAGGREQADINLRAVPALHIFVDLSAEHQQANESILLPGLTGLKRIVFGTQIPSDALLNQSPTASEMAEFTGVPPGHYELTQGTPPRIVELDATTSQQVDPSLGTPTVNVSGSLRATSGFAFPEDLQVILSPLDTAQAQTALQANCVKGSFTFVAVSPESWKLTAFTPGKTLSISSIFVGGQMHAGNALTVRDKPLQAEVLVSLSDTRVEGFAREPGAGKSGKGIAGVMVVLIPRNPAANGDQFRRDQSDSDGSFSLLDVAPGEYTIVAIKDGWELDWARPEIIERYLPKGIPVTVTESSGKLMRLSGGIPVQGRQ